MCGLRMKYYAVCTQFFKMCNTFQLCIIITNVIIIVECKAFRWERLFYLEDDTMWNDFIIHASENIMIKLAIIGIVADTIFGVLRAIKEHKLNTSIGINGAIRKTGMILSLLIFQMVDVLVKLNLIGFIPEEIRSYLGGSIGTTEFFALLYIAYEAVSTLKNMALCGLPVKRVWNAVQKFLGKYTDELPKEKRK